MRIVIGGNRHASSKMFFIWWQTLKLEKKTLKNVALRLKPKEENMCSVTTIS